MIPFFCKKKKKTMIDFCRKESMRHWRDIFDEQDDNPKKFLLLQAEFTTDHWLLRHWPFKTVLPIGSRVYMKLGFKNIGEEAIPEIKKVGLRIHYPQGSRQIRKWDLNIPNLPPGDEVWTQPPWLFMPEVPGHHTMALLRPCAQPELLYISASDQLTIAFSRGNGYKIAKNEDLTYAKSGGLINRDHAHIDGPWTASFYISNGAESITIIIIFFTAALAFISIFLTVVQVCSQWFLQSTPFQIIFDF